MTKKSKRITLLLKVIFVMALILGAISPAWGCTSLLVGKDASADGSTIITYAAASHVLYGALRHTPAATHPKGSMREVREWDTNKHLGYIPEVEHTYSVVGNMNEHQVSITESTWGGREELVDTTGIIDYGSLIFIALERSKTAREAIYVMTTLVEKYGYYSSGESFSIADPNEVWVLEMIGKGGDSRGAVWVAMRIPDNAISGHANQSRIHQFPLKDKDNCLYSKDVISFARKKGYFNGKDADFSFSKAYSITDFGALRGCDARVWSFFNRHAAIDMSQYLDYAKGDNPNNPMPLFVKPKHKLTLQEVKDAMRDHYEGTPFEIQSDLGMGPYEMPYRPTPLTYEVDGRKYFNERPISTQQASCIYVAQMRSWLPDYVGGVLWFGNDDPNMVAMVPIYCCTKGAPECFDVRTADAFTFSFKSAFWMCNWVSNMVYFRYCQLFPELQKVRDGLEQDFASLQPQIERDALAKSEQEAKSFLSEYSHRMSGRMLSEWMDLAQLLIVKYNDMAVKRVDDNGEYLKTPGGYQQPIVRPGYPEQYRRRIVEQTGDKYLIK